MEENQRPYDACHLIKKDALKDYHCEDDFLWRTTDYFIRQTAEKSGYKYGKIASTMHINNETERIRYPSDSEKSYSKIVCKEPELVIIDKEKERKIIEKNAKSIVKYLDPENACVCSNKGLDKQIGVLDKEWIKKNGPKWLSRYDKVISINFKIKNKLYHFLKGG